MASPLQEDISTLLLATCQANAVEAASALKRCLGGDYQLTPKEISEFSAAKLPAEFSGPGLALVLHVADMGALVLIPEANAILPPWAAKPDKSQTSQLKTLAQELGMLLLPEDCMPENFSAIRVAGLTSAIMQAELMQGALCLPHKLVWGEKSTTLLLVWPAKNGQAIQSEEALVAAPASEPAPAPSQPEPVAVASPPPAPIKTPAKPAPSVENGLASLPPYTRSLLKIRVPVRVMLAETQLPMSRITELAQGAIIAFEKSCEEMLKLNVGETEIAVGEAVKIGDKFGLRITSMVMPEEKFWAVRGHRGKQAG